jgi:hypothetical protein
MINLDNAATPPDTDGLKFVLAEDLNNPDGGIFERFPGMFGANLPATPADTPYTTDIYTIEYSGASDFPQYPTNLLADLNASDGYFNLLNSLGPFGSLRRALTSPPVTSSFPPRICRCWTGCAPRPARLRRLPT